MKNDNSIQDHAGGSMAKIREFYTTDRLPTYTSDGKVSYGSGERNLNGVKYGIATVGLRLNADGDSSIHGVLSIPPYSQLTDPPPNGPLDEAAVLDLSEFQSVEQRDEALFAELEKDPNLFIFEHGYHNPDFFSLETAASIKLTVGGVMLAFLWPSQGGTLDYWKDQDIVDWANDDTLAELKHIFTELRKRNLLGKVRVHLLLHSMGNHVGFIMERLNDWFKHEGFVDAEGKLLPVFANIMFICADTDQLRFARYAQTCVEMTEPGGVFIFASSEDKALAASEELHGGEERLGQIKLAKGEAGFPTKEEGVETVEFGAIDVKPLGHAIPKVAVKAKAYRTPLPSNLKEVTLREGKSPVVQIRKV